MKYFFISDIHGNVPGLRKLFDLVSGEKPDAVLFGGDILPKGLGLVEDPEAFIEDEFLSRIRALVEGGGSKTRFFVIMGNDDPRKFERAFIKANEEGIIDYVHDKTVPFDDLFITGYSYVNPTPFQFKDWERYDVSRHVDVGCVSPEEGVRTVPIPQKDIKTTTIAEDLKNLVLASPPEKTIYLFHAPPYDSHLDRAALDGMMVDHVPLDVHVGSIAAQRFIDEVQPLLTLHGHIHESARITGHWREVKGRTHSFSAAHEGPELALIRFDTNDLANASRELVPLS